MKRVTKIVTFYDDGTFTESVPYVGAPMPTVPLNPTPFNPADPYFKASNCPKCGLKLEGVMGYVCNNYPCPSGLGGAWSMCGND